MPSGLSRTLGQGGLSLELILHSEDFVESRPMTSCVDWQLQQALGKLHVKLEWSLMFQLCRVLTPPPPSQKNKEQEMQAAAMRPKPKT